MTESNNKYYLENREVYIEKAKKRYNENKEEMKQYFREYYLKNKDKHRKRSLKNRYNISLKEYDKILKEQKYVCKICGCKDTKKLSVDHNHETGEVRGLLCHSCNTSLGLLKENSLIMIKMVKYINGDV